MVQLVDLRILRLKSKYVLNQVNDDGWMMLMPVADESVHFHVSRVKVIPCRSNQDKAALQYDIQYMERNVCQNRTQNVGPNWICPKRYVEELMPLVAYLSPGRIYIYLSMYLSIYPSHRLYNNLT